MMDMHMFATTHNARFRRSSPGNRSQQRGVSMIEVLIAVLIMGIGLLGMAAMQTTALRNSQSALERSQAAMYAYSILDAMRANPDEATIGEYNLTTPTCDVPVSDGTLATADLIEWLGDLRSDQGLGTSACALIACDSVECSVTVSWDDSRGSGGDAGHSFTAETQL